MKKPSIFPFSAVLRFSYLVLLVPILLPSIQASDLTATNKLRLEVASPNGNWFELRSNGLLISRSTSTTGSLLSADLSAEGPLLLWNPGLGQFRAGSFAWYNFQTEYFGEYTAAFGYRTTAGGFGSFASGQYSEAFGWNSFAAGYTTYALGDGAIAMGMQTSAYGEGSVALGSYASAAGSFSLALGHTTFAGGMHSTAMGAETIADAYAATAVGFMNLGGGDPENWHPQDPIFEIGNGSLGTEANNWQPFRSNALTVYKDGTVIIPKAQGDISMGEFGN